MDKSERMILDIHRHSEAPAMESVLSKEPHEILELQHSGSVTHEWLSSQSFSSGWHPWHLPAGGLSDKQIGMLEQTLRQPEIVAVGETGIDKTRLESPLFAQINAFRAHLELAIRYRKPLILHAVRAQDIIIPVINEYREKYADAVYFPKIAVHGFRGKPTIAVEYLRAGCYLSFGERFNADTLQSIPADRILAETDESSIAIEEIISRMGDVRREITEELIYANTAAFLKGGG